MCVYVMYVWVCVSGVCECNGCLMYHLCVSGVRVVI